MDKNELESVINFVVKEIRKSGNKTNNFACEGKGIFLNIDDAIKAAKTAQEELSRIPMEIRGKIIAAMRRTVEKNIELIAKTSVEETKLGKYEDKKQKNLLAARKTPGVEDIMPVAYTGDYGFTLEEKAPYGVIGAITPSTNPSETVISNGIGMIGAGNSVVFNSHPSAKKITKLTIELLNEAIIKAGGPANLLCGVEEPNAETGNTLMKHPDIRILVVTGGPGIVRVAMNSGKKAICAGPGNPPVVVDETADIERAAKDIVDGAAFDNNVLCIAEKEIFVVKSVAKQLLTKMIEQGAYLLTREQLDALMVHITKTDKNGKIEADREYIGKDVQIILKTIGVTAESDKKLAIAVVENDHPLVNLEQLMPVIPIVITNDVDQAIEFAFKAEQQNYHTAVMHSTNVTNLSKMARTINTSIFVKNAPSYSGLGMYGEGHATFTIASPTGEGLTSAKTFTRQRRCILKDQFRIV